MPCGGCAARWRCWRWSRPASRTKCSTACHCCSRCASAAMFPPYMLQCCVVVISHEMVPPGSAAKAFFQNLISSVQLVCCVCTTEPLKHAEPFVAFGADPHRKHASRRWVSAGRSTTLWSAATPARPCSGSRLLSPMGESAFSIAAVDPVKNVVLLSSWAGGLLLGCGLPTADCLLCASANAMARRQVDLRKAQSRSA